MNREEIISKIDSFLADYEGLSEDDRDGADWLEWLYDAMDVLNDAKSFLSGESRYPFRRFNE